MINILAMEDDITLMWDSNENLVWLEMQNSPEYTPQELSKLLKTFIEHLDDLP